MSLESETFTLLCTYDGCGRSVLARKMCGQHWGRSRDGRPMDGPQRRSDGLCAHDGCDKSTRTKSVPYCRLHLYRDLHGLRMSTVAGVRTSMSNPSCASCEYSPWARGLCSRHYAAAWKAGKLTTKDGARLGPPPPAECANCHETKPIKSRGLCSRCHMAATRAGTLDEVALASHRKVRDDTMSAA